MKINNHEQQEQLVAEMESYLDYLKKTAQIDPMNLTLGYTTQAVS